MEREIGIQITATMTTRTTADFGSQSVTSEPRTSSLSQSEAAPPGAALTRSAKPAQTNDMARVTTMSGTFVKTITTPLTPPTSRPMASTSSTTPIPNSPLWPFISEAQTTLVSAICDPIERSMPPLMTTTACATAARASGRTPIARP